MHAGKVSNYGSLHLTEEGRKKERNSNKQKLKLNEQRKHCEKIVEALLLY
jgi:hypothetical protein